MLTVSWLIGALIITGIVLFILSFFVAPRNSLWLASALCFVAALVLKVFGVGA